MSKTKNAVWDRIENGEDITEQKPNTESED